MGTGFMKWVDTTRDEADVSVGSVVVDAAIRVIDMEDVFVARMVWEGHILAREENISNLSEGISGTASMTKSTSDNEEREVCVVRRALVASASDWDIRSLVTFFARSFSGQLS